MPRSPVVYSLVPGTVPQVPDTPIPSAMFNAAMLDIEQTFNTVQPIAYGGTGAATAVAGGDALTVKGADIASAATTNIGAATGDFITITGTATITSLGTATAGIERVLYFDGILTLTHNATSLILYSRASINTYNGLVMTFRSLGGGNWVETSQTMAVGTFTPTFSATGSTFSYATQAGSYTKLGKQVTVHIVLVLNAGGNTLAGNPLSITLPFTLGTSNAVSTPIGFSGAAAAFVNMYGIAGGGSASISVYGNTGATASNLTSVNASGGLSGGAIMQVSITYTSI